MKKPKSGGYFLAPFKGKRIDRLIRAIVERQPGQWDVVDAGGHIGTARLASCVSITSGEARKILKVKQK